MSRFFWTCPECSKRGLLRPGRADGEWQWVECPRCNYRWCMGIALYAELCAARGVDNGPAERFSR